ncbi:MAG: hypothetical protein JWR85_4036 [Marmoricola sp.]|nr:hypothetical protein [Marmoricola sp.]
MSRKSTGTAAKILIPFAAVALLLTGCGEPSPLANYSGPAVIKDHRTSGKSCYGTVEAPNGVKASVRFGTKSVCRSLKDGGTANIDKGNVVR